MMIPTEPIGSIPRPLRLIEAIAAMDGTDAALDSLYEEAIRDTIARFEATGSPVITDGEQRKYHNFWTYSVHGLKNTSPDGFKIPFSAGHTRRIFFGRNPEQFSEVIGIATDLKSPIVKRLPDLVCE